MMTIKLPSKHDGFAFQEDVEMRFKAYHWQVLRVDDSEDLDALAAAVEEAKADTERPSLIMVRTHIGYGSPKQDSPSAHGEPLGEEALRATKEKAGWDPDKTFVVPAAGAGLFRRKAAGLRQSRSGLERHAESIRRSLSGTDQGIPGKPCRDSARLPWEN
jgi:transketolase